MKLIGRIDNGGDGVTVWAGSTHRMADGKPTDCLVEMVAGGAIVRVRFHGPEFRELCAATVTNDGVPYYPLRQ